MKKCWLSIVVLMLLYCSGKLFGQVPDTTAYLENIVKIKAQYIGKPFSDLEKDLKITVKSFAPIPESSMDNTKEGATVLNFVNLFNKKDFNINPSIIIYWKAPLNMGEVDTYYEKYYNYDWKDEIEEHYKNGIIDDIDIL